MDEVNDLAINSETERLARLLEEAMWHADGCHDDEHGGPLRIDAYNSGSGITVKDIRDTLKQYGRNRYPFHKEQMKLLGIDTWE